MSRGAVPIFNKAIRNDQRFGRPIDEYLRRITEEQPAEENVDDTDELIQINFMPSWDDLAFALTIESFQDFVDTQAIFTKAVEVEMIAADVTSIKYEVEGFNRTARREMRRGNEEDFFQCLDDIETVRTENREHDVTLIVVRVGPTDERTMMERYAS